MAAVAVIFASYFRALTGVAWNESTIAAAALLTLTGINCFGARAGSNVQSGLMLLKIGAIAALVIIGFTVGGHAPEQATPLLEKPFSFDVLKSIGAAMVPIAFAYGGGRRPLLSPLKFEIRAVICRADCCWASWRRDALSCNESRVFACARSDWTRCNHNACL